MDIDEIKRRIEDVQNDADHPEKTLSDKGSNEEYLRQKEGYLWYKVLEAIANGADNTQELAKETIESIYIDFRRGEHHN